MIDVKHIAKLARLGLTKEEEKKFEKELSAILDFVEKLKEIDTSKVEPMTGGTSLVNIDREDQLKSKIKNFILSEAEGQRLKILKNAPSQEKGYFKVKKILE